MLLAMHDNLRDVDLTYGQSDESARALEYLPGVKIAQRRCKTVFVKGYSTERQRETIQTLFKLSVENCSRSRALILHQIEGVKTGSREIYVFKNGKFPDNDGILGKDFQEYPSLRRAQQVAQNDSSLYRGYPSE